MTDAEIAEIRAVAGLLAAFSDPETIPIRTETCGKLAARLHALLPREETLEEAVHGFLVRNDGMTGFAGKVSVLVTDLRTLSLALARRLAEKGEK